MAPTHKGCRINSWGQTTGSIFHLESQRHSNSSDSTGRKGALSSKSDHQTPSAWNGSNTFSFLHKQASLSSFTSSVATCQSSRYLPTHLKIMQRCKAAQKARAHSYTPSSRPTGSTQLSRWFPAACQRRGRTTHGCQCNQSRGPTPEQEPELIAFLSLESILK